MSKPRRFLSFECKNGKLQNEKITIDKILSLVPENYTGNVRFLVVTEEKQAALDSFIAQAIDWKRVQDGAEERVGYQQTIERKNDSLYDSIVKLQSFLTNKLF